MATAIEKRVKRAEKICPDNQAQLTPIRKALLSIIYQHDDNLTAYELLHLFRVTNPKAESMTVYRANEKITKADADFTQEITGFAIGGIPPIGHKEKFE